MLAIFPNANNCSALRHELQSCSLLLIRADPCRVILLHVCRSTSDVGIWLGVARPSGSTWERLAKTELASTSFITNHRTIPVLSCFSSYTRTSDRKNRSLVASRFTIARGVELI